jgi:hypothetical protein
MDTRLHQLETFGARGSDGRDYKVCGFERMARDVTLPQQPERWQSTGVIEFRLDDGTAVHAGRDGQMALDNGVTLTRH